MKCHIQEFTSHQRGHIYIYSSSATAAATRRRTNRPSNAWQTSPGFQRICLHACVPAPLKAVGPAPAALAKRHLKTPQSES